MKKLFSKQSVDSVKETPKNLNTLVKQVSNTNRASNLYRKELRQFIESKKIDILLEDALILYAIKKIQEKGDLQSNIATICEYVSILPPAGTRAVKRMIELKLVKRVKARKNEDGRIVIIDLTAKGQKLLTKLLAN